MRNKIVVLLALLAITGFAAASALTVKHRQETASLHAERFSIGELFVLDQTTLSPTLAAAEPAGVLGSPVEMASGVPTANTRLTRDHWQYAVRVKEALAGGVTGGQFTVELSVDGVFRSLVYVSQSTNEPSTASTEGVQVVFDLGLSIQPSSLYFVQVKPYTPPGQTIAHTLRSGMDGNNAYAWFGANGALEPTITLAMGNALALTAKNDDTSTNLAPHNIGIKSGTALADPPGFSGRVDTIGEEATITWTPTAAGTYTYVCEFHGSMVGTITVTA